MGCKIFNRVLKCGCAIAADSSNDPANPNGDAGLSPCFAEYGNMKKKKDRDRLALHDKCWAEYRAREKNEHYLPRKTKAEKAELKRLPGIPIQIWRFDQAPKELQALSQNGGDEDWIAVIPAKLWEDECKYIPWLREGTFGVCSVDEYKTANGDIVLIGCHA